MRLLIVIVVASGILMVIAGFHVRVGAADIAAGAPGSTVPPPLPPDSIPPPSSDNSAKARALVEAAINMTDSNRAVGLLWQATDLDPTLEEPYVYLGLFYNSRSQFDRVVQVYQKLVKYHPKETSAWLNIGEAYMSYTPPRFEAALPFFQKGLELDPGSCFAAFRIGEIYAQESSHEGARYLRQASQCSNNPEIAEQARHIIAQMGW
jgi:tetratricopeptide (TPR) repeat protein